MNYKAAIHKFSTKPPGYDAARQRENQRRHRARVKCRITELEASLEATQNRLEEALERIKELTAEVQGLRSTVQPDPQSSGRTDPVASGGGQGCCKSSENASDPQPYRDSPSHPLLRPALQNLNPTEAPQPNDIQLSIPPPLTTRGVDTFALRLNSQQITGNDPNDDCALLPPPSPGESTMRCREAYSLLKDQVMHEFDPDLVTEWLKPGFRSAVCAGDGCRVQTHVLFALVDHITSA